MFEWLRTCAVHLLLFILHRFDLFLLGLYRFISRWGLAFKLLSYKGITSKVAAQSTRKPLMHWSQPSSHNLPVSKSIPGWSMYSTALHLLCTPPWHLRPSQKRFWGLYWWEGIGNYTWLHLIGCSRHGSNYSQCVTDETLVWSTPQDNYSDRASQSRQMETVWSSSWHILDPLHQVRSAWLISISDQQKFLSLWALQSLIGMF